ncbi:MAG TPA: hypothetical protein VFK04_02900 [Gemmatimonadaceae bacterium]|jgi:hypothetical protein|nr:hypothetical protein [Gemmatimonadaceae bacterium]
MGQIDRNVMRARGLGDISRQETRSVTHGEFWIPDEERELYKQVLAALNSAGVPYVVAGAYAVHAHTGIYRETKDLDLFVEPEQVVPAMRALRAIGLIARLEQAHWLAKATRGRRFVDVIFGMGNGMALINREWYAHSTPAILAATPVRVAPVEELIWHRLFINERHRQDMSDIVHLIASVGSLIDWQRLLTKTGEHWPLLLSQILVFLYVYPELSDRVPSWLLDDLLERAHVEARRERSGERVTRGTLISRFSFTIDVHEWGFRDVRAEEIGQMEKLPILREIAESDVWDESSRAVAEYRARVA